MNKSELSIAKAHQRSAALFASLARDARMSYIADGPRFVSDNLYWFRAYAANADLSAWCARATMGTNE